MSPGLLLGLGAALCWGFTDVAGALASRRVGSLRALAGAQLVSLAILGLVVVIVPSAGRWNLAVVPTALALGVGAAIAYLSFFTALRIGPITVVSPVVAAYGGLVVVLAVILRGETLSPLQAFGAALATAGVVLTGLAFDGGLRNTRVEGAGVPLAIVALVFFAIVTVGLAGPIEQTGWLAAIVWSRVGNLVAVWLLLGAVSVARPAIARPLLEASQPASPAAILPIGAAGALDVIGFISFAVGLEIAPTWIVGLASSFGPAVAVLVAYVFLGERPRRNQWLGFGAIAAGLAAVALP